MTLNGKSWVVNSSLNSLLGCWFTFLDQNYFKVTFGADPAGTRLENFKPKSTRFGPNRLESMSTQRRASRGSLIWLKSFSNKNSGITTFFNFFPWAVIDSSESRSTRVKADSRSAEPSRSRLEKNESTLNVTSRHWTLKKLFYHIWIDFHLELHRRCYRNHLLKLAADSVLYRYETF